SNLNDPSGMQNGFSTEDYPYGLNLSTDGVFSGTTYEAAKTWMIKARVTDDRNISSLKDLSFSTLTSINGTAGNLISDFTLLNNYPNPFNPSTTINFSIGTGSRFTLKLYNTSGAVVDEVFENKFYEPGNYSYNWDKGRKLSSGIYFFGMETDQGIRKMKKITILK
ncbi:MAG: T9SS type A sorting domain-containing protein, partial [Candidatus Delongbacteria bacterium]